MRSTAFRMVTSGCAILREARLASKYATTKETPHRERAVPKKPFQALHDFRRTHIDAHRSHRLVSRIANRRVRGQPQTPLIPDKILVGLKIVEANNVVWIGALVDVSDVGLVDPVFLGIQDKLGRGGIAGIGRIE